jgi:competence ComEA-like helix-hairpin-helix protein
MSDEFDKYSLIKELFNKNNNEIKEKILATLKENPSESDGKGFVYGFKHEKDNNTKEDFWMKLGRTIKFDPNERVEEWEGSQMVFSLQTEFNRRLERLIHLLFDFAHKIRRNTKTKKRETEWFHFTERINIVKYTSEIAEFVEDKYVISSNNNNSNTENDHYDEMDINETSESETEGETSNNNEKPKININIATEKELMTLRGIGKGLAKNILEYRETKKFEKIEDIKKVQRIGSGIFNDIKNRITV